MWHKMINFPMNGTKILLRYKTIQTGPRAGESPVVLGKWDSDGAFLDSHGYLLGTEKVFEAWAYIPPFGGI